jgi:hypothetical protein
VVTGERHGSRLSPEHPFSNPSIQRRGGAPRRRIGVWQPFDSVHGCLKLNRAVPVQNLGHRRTGWLSASPWSSAAVLPSSRACCGIAEVFGPCRIICCSSVRRSKPCAAPARRRDGGLGHASTDPPAPRRRDTSAIFTHAAVLSRTAIDRQLA